VMELPPYRTPTLRNVWRHMWERTASFVRKAWTLILLFSVLIWLLLAVPLRGEGTFAATPVNDSLFAGVARVIAPAFAPAGFGTWQASGSLLSGFVAKEVIVSSIALVYGVEEETGAQMETTAPPTAWEDVGTVIGGFARAVWDTVKSLPLLIGINLFEAEDAPAPTALMTTVATSFDASSGGHGLLAGLAFMVFVLLYTPCMVAVAAERQELGVRWMWFSVIGQTGIAWLMAVLVFQGGKLLGLG
ncbi:MAG: ferrous iron transporter B, partial [Caldilineaceae bacterium]|nr:ferrous iron transporter B [Caldilineaceae bacterium]